MVKLWFLNLAKVLGFLGLFVLALGAVFLVGWLLYVWIGMWVSLVLPLTFVVILLTSLMTAEQLDEEDDDG